MLVYLYQVADCVMQNLNMNENFKKVPIKWSFNMSMKTRANYRNTWLFTISRRYWVFIGFEFQLCSWIGKNHFFLSLSPGFICLHGLHGFVFFFLKGKLYSFIQREYSIKYNRKGIIERSHKKTKTHISDPKGTTYRRAKEKYNAHSLGIIWDWFLELMVKWVKWAATKDY